MVSLLYPKEDRLIVSVCQESHVGNQTLDWYDVVAKSAPKAPYIESQLCPQSFDMSILKPSSWALENPE